jgi:putative endonuclease
VSKTEKKITGDKGEDLVAKLLEKRGHKIISRNFWKPWGEIDIISEENGILHFTEVKTVTVKNDSGDFSAEDNVHKEKRGRLSKIVETYLENNHLLDRDFQIDVAAVTINQNTGDTKIEMIEDIDLS